MEHPEKIKQKPQRVHRLSRRTWVLLAVGVTLLLATGFVLLLPTIRERFPSQLSQSLKANLTFQSLDIGDKNILDTITVSHADGESYTMQYRNEALYLVREGQTNEIVNEGYTDAIVKAATEVAVEDTVATDVSKVADHLADMGLAPPDITVKVTYANGREVNLQVGTQVPGTTYYYYRWSGDQGVYMCDTGIYDAFHYTAQMLLPVDQPALAPVLIDRVTIQTPAAGVMECTFAADGTNTYQGTLKQPYVYPMDSEAANTLLSAFSNFRLGTKLGAVDTANRAEYGFDSPTAIVDVHQQQGLTSSIDADGVLQTQVTEAQTIRLTFGKQDGDYFYYCEYAGDCYRVSSFLVTTLVNASSEKYLSRAPADLGSANIASITVQLGSGALDIRATYNEHLDENNQITTDDDGNTVYDVSVTLNGNALTTESFDALVDRLKLMTVSGRLDTAQTPTGTPRWQMTITTTAGATRTLAAYPMDAFNDLLVVDGVALHYLNSEAIQIALAELYPAAKLGIHWLG